jgi:hypothetical protein
MDEAPVDTIPGEILDSFVTSRTAMFPRLPREFVATVRGRD